MRLRILAAAWLTLVGSASAQEAKQAAQQAADLVNAGRFETAVEKYRDAVRLEPGNASLHLSLGLAFQSLGKLDEAVDSINRAIGLSPDDPQAHYSLALLHEARAVEARRSGDNRARARALESARDAWRSYSRLEKSPDRLKTADKHLFTIGEQLKD